MSPLRALILVVAALLALLAPGSARAFELDLAADAPPPREPWIWRLTVRLSPPLTNAEILDDDMGTMAVLAGSVELDFLELVGLEAGGSWLHTESLEDPAWDVFVRVNGLLGLYDGRTAAPAGEDDTAWRFEAVASVGYRFLHEVEELDPLIGSLDLHALTLGAGAAAIWWFEPTLGLEFRLLPTVSIALAETTDGAWGQPAGSNPGVVVADPTPGDTGSTPSFTSSTTVGNEDETDWGLDLELTVGLVF